MDSISSSNWSEVSSLGADSSQVDEEKEVVIDNKLPNNLIVHVWSNSGTILQVKKSTWCYLGKSRFAQNINIWMRDNSFRDESGLVLMELDLESEGLKQIVNHLQLMSMQNFLGQRFEEVKKWDPTASCRDTSGVYSASERVMWLIHTKKMSESKAKEMVMEEFPASFELQLKAVHYAPLPICIDLVHDKSSFYSYLLDQFSSCIRTHHKIDTNILKSQTDEAKLWKLLFEANKTVPSRMNLLYHASKDGWEVSDFHTNCDDHGPTLTIVKTTEGYIFGGYTDRSWQSNAYFTPGTLSDKAFLFSLKSHKCKISPIKMNIICSDYAQHNSCNLGPTFGERDLCLGPFGKLKVGYTDLGKNSCYILPESSDEKFLSGHSGNDDLFEIEELEVFEVTEF